MSTEPNKAPARAWYQRKRLWIILASLAALTVVCLVSMPYGIRYGLADYLRQHGARSVSIGNVDFNPFSGRLVFQGVEATDDGDQRLALDRLELVLSWRDLFSRRARIQAVDLQGLQATVDVSDPTQVEVSGMRFPLVSGDQPAVEEPAEAKPWGFALDRVMLERCDLELHREGLQIDLQLASLRVEKVISWQLKTLAELSLKGLVNKAPLSIEAQAGLFGEAPEVEGEITLRGFELAGLQPLLGEHGGLSLAGSLSLSQRFSLALASGGSASWSSGGALSGDRLDAHADRFSGQDLSLRWQGKTTGSWSEQGLEVALDGSLDGALPKTGLSEPALALALGGYQWQGRLDLKQDTAGLNLQLAGELHLSDLELTQPDSQPRQISSRQLSLSALSLQLHQAPEGALTIGQRGELRLEGSRLRLNRLEAGLASMRWNGSVSLEPGREQPTLQAAGASRLEGVQLAEQGDSSQDGMAGLRVLELNELKLAPGNQLTLAGVRLLGIRLENLSDPKAPLLTSDAISLDRLQFGAASGLEIGTIEQQGMQADVVLDTDGRLNLQQALAQLQRAAAGAEPEPASVAGKPESAPGEPMPMRISRIVWQGKNQARFTDRSVKPPFSLSLDVKEFRLSDIDSRRPDLASPFSFSGGTGRHASIAAKGSLTLFNSDPSGKIQGRLVGVEMLPLSSYTVPSIGYRLESGELDADIDLALAQGLVKGSNHLIIRQLEVAEASQEQAEALNAKISMPLDTALGMLQDDNQTIDLNLPVSGKLSDPNVALGDVINTALGKALKKGAMTYLTTALFPYGTMVALLKMASDEASAVQLNPIEFAPGDDGLDETDRDYLTKLAKVLKERPKISIKICGMATASDRQAIAQARAAAANPKEAKEPERKAGRGEAQSVEPTVTDAELQALARHRAERVEDYLVDGLGISPGRAAVCRPQIDPKEEAQSRVDLQI